jgi:hypothetical protein
MARCVNPRRKALAQEIVTMSGSDSSCFTVKKRFDKCRMRGRLQEKPESVPITGRTVSAANPTAARGSGTFATLTEALKGM